MKKLSKILVLLFAVVTILTAFTIVSSAEEAAAPDSYTMSILNYESSSYTDGYDIWAGSDSTRDGKITVRISDDGNKYAVYSPLANTGTAGNFSEPDFGAPVDATTKNHVYNLVDYPYVMIDFDIMTPNGKFDACPSFAPRIHYTTEAGVSTYITVFSLFQVSDFSTYLDSTPYNWQHVSVVLEHDFETDAETGVSTKGTVTIHYIINGEYKFSGTATPSPLKGHLPDDYGYKSLRLNAQNATGTTQTAIDNVKFSYFNEAFNTSEDIKVKTTAMAATVYNADYDMPFGKTVATIGTTPYDDINEAIAAAVDGQTIKLSGNVEGTILVDNKAISIDKNVYDENGVATGEYYEITCSSTTHVPTETDGIITFTFLQNASTYVYWDDCPAIVEGVDCYCKGDFAGHIMSAVTENAMLNTVPTYPGTIPEFEIVNGVAKKFVGWSYTQGGKAEEIRAITQEDIYNDGVSLYPVYETIQYGISVKAPNGEITYYLAEEYYKALTSAESGSTVTLLTNIETEYGFTVSKNLIIDLNGKSLRRWNVSNVEYYWDTTTNKSAGVKTYGTKPSVFHMGGNNATLTIMSSKPGATIYNGTLMSKNLYWDNANRTELVKETAYDNVMGGQLVGWSGVVGATVNIYGENLSFFGSEVVDCDTGSAKDATVNIDGGTYYRTVSDYSALITNRNGAKFNFKNATFVANNASLLYVWAAKTKQHQEMVFDNCDFIEGDFYTNDSAQITFKNCRIEATNFKKDSGDASLGVAAADVKNFIIGEGCYVNAPTMENTTISDTCMVIDYTYSKTVTLSALTAHKLNADKTDLDKEATYNAGTREDTTKYSYVVINKASSLANVKWVDAEGNILAESQALKNAVVTPPVSATVPSGDGYRAIVINEWLNANGEVDYTIGDADEYTFTAVIPTENITYVSDFVDTQFNLRYYNGFHMNVYIPYIEGVKPTMVNSLGNNIANAYSEVLINGEKYWCMTIWSATTYIFNDDIVTVGVTIDEVTYSAKYKISGLIYAEIVLNDATATELEKNCVANMVRFVRESLQEYGSSNQSIYTRIDALIGSEDGTTEGVYKLADYIANSEYPDLDADAADLDKYIESISFRVSGTYAAYVFTKTDLAVQLGATISVKSASASWGLRSNTGADKTPWTLNLRLYHAIETCTVTVHIPKQVDAETGEVIAEAQTVSATYSIGAYINATDSELSKALYAFGVAAKDYVNNRKDY